MDSKWYMAIIKNRVNKFAQAKNRLFRKGFVHI